MQLTFHSGLPPPSSLFHLIQFPAARTARRRMDSSSLRLQVEEFDQLSLPGLPQDFPTQPQQPKE